MGNAAEFEPIPAHTEAIASNLIDAALRVHRALGPGLLESVYEACLCHELGKLGLPFQPQVDVPVEYDGVRLGIGLRLDILAGGHVVAELKAVEKIEPLHQAQLLTYMELAGVRLGFLINFNVAQMKDGIVRMVL